MLSLSLDEHRCNTCTKLLFKGTPGMGLIEVKCSRCGTLSLIHSFDNYLKAKPTAYIIVYNPVGRVIAGSKSTERILGKSIAEIQDIHDIQPDIKLPPVPNVKVGPDGALTQLEEWQHAYETLPHTATHIGANGKKLDVTARYYPVPAHLDTYVVGVYYTV